MSDRLEQIRRSWSMDGMYRRNPGDEADVRWLLDKVDRLREGHHRILWNRRPDGDCGSIDEVVFRRPEMVHIEQMHDTCWWMAIYLDGTDRYWTGNFVADKGLDFTEQEGYGFEWEDDRCHAEWEPEDAD